MSKNSQRINGFDALRTIAMWLGILLHGIIVYKKTPESNWPSDTQLKSPFLDWLYEFIHLFRMPLFFLVAGFFARLVIIRSGEGYFIRQRLKRILIPFLIGVVVLVPLSLLPFHYYRLHYVEGLPENESWSGSFRAMVGWNGLLHLWFLYYLIIFYVLFIAGTRAMKVLKVDFSAFLSRSLYKITPLKLAAAVMLLFGVFILFEAYIPPVYTGIRPNLFYIFYYGFFFLAGWVMQTNMNSVTSLKGMSWVYFTVGLGISILHYFDITNFNFHAELFLMALGTISLVSGITGLFLRYCQADNAGWRYFSDSAYWVYLIHVFIVAGCQVFLLPFAFSGWIKLGLVMAITFAISLSTYHFLVRYTIVGEYLHGKRERKKAL